MNRYFKLALAAALVVIGLVVIVYINSQPSTAPSASPSPSISTTLPITAHDVEGCYAYEADDGTRYTLNIDAQDEKNFLGFMEYNNVGFDSSRGLYSGQFINLRAVGIYEFEAEGTKSKRQLVFFYDSGAFVSGKGKTKLVDGIELFVDLETLTRDFNYVFDPSRGCATK